MSSDCTVITASLPERAELLAEACESVQAQTLEADSHLVWMDAAREGPALARNHALDLCKTTLVAFLDDDDVLYADHLRILVHALRNADADLAFSWHDDGPGVPRFESWGAEARAHMTAGMNVVPVTVVCRADTLAGVGGFDPADRYEDYSAWCRMLAHGARFVCVPQVTWRYRIAPDGRTWNP